MILSQRSKLPTACPRHDDYKLYGKNCDQLCPPGDEEFCRNNGTCVEVDSSLTTLPDMIGKPPLENITHVCSCANGWTGQECRDDESIVSKQFNETDCNGGNYTVENIITHCNCAGTHSHGWHCEISDSDLCPRECYKQL